MDWLKKAKEAKAKMQELLKTANDAERAFTAEEKAEFDELNKKHDEYVEMDKAEKNLGDINNLHDEIVNDDDIPDPDVRVTGNPPKWKDDEDFYGSVIKAKVGHKWDDRLNTSIQNAGNTDVPDQGSFLVESQSGKKIADKVFDSGEIISRCAVDNVGKNFNGITYPYVVENDRSSASTRHGGVIPYWIDQEGAFTETDVPTIGRYEIKLVKGGVLMYLNDELMQDTTAMVSVINRKVPDALEWMIEDAIINGTGSGELLGIVTSNSFVAVAKETGQPAASYVYQNALRQRMQMWSKSLPKSVWLYNQDLDLELGQMGLAIGAGGSAVYVPPGGASAAPYANLMGRPLIPSEHTSAVGTVGDIMLVDLSKYQIIRKGGLNRAVSVHVLFTTDRVALRFKLRIGGSVMPEWKTPVTPANSSNTRSPFTRLATRA